MGTDQLPAGLFLFLALSSCTTTYLSRENPGRDLPVFPGDASRPYQVVGHVSLHQSSFYVLGFLSLVPLDLPGLLKRDLPRAVREMGGEALLFAEVRVTPPGFPNLLKFPFLASSGKAEVSGLAVRWTGPKKAASAGKEKGTYVSPICAVDKKTGKAAPLSQEDPPREGPPERGEKTER